MTIKPTAAVLRRTPDVWQLAVVSGPGTPPDVAFTTLALESPSAASDAMDRIANELTARGLAGVPLFIAVPSEPCVTAALPTATLQSLPRAAWMYELESQLIDSAEDLVVDYYTSAETTLGIGVRVADWQPLVAACEAHDHPIRSIMPTACLVAESLLPLADSARLILFELDGRLECFESTGKSLSGWATLTPDPKQVATHLRALLLKQGTSLRLASFCTPEFDAALRGALPEGEIIRPALDKPIESMAIARAAEILQKPATPHLELLRDRLSPHEFWSEVRRPASYLAAGLVALASLLCGYFVWTAWQYDAIAADYAAQQASIFRSVFPGRSVPPGIRSRLESELRQLRGTSGDAVTEIPQDSAFVVLHRAMAALPTSLRFRILDIRGEGRQLALIGEARTHGEAETLATALEATGQFQVAPVTTSNLGERGVSFNISATFQEPKSGDKS